MQRAFARVVRAAALVNDIVRIIQKHVPCRKHGKLLRFCREHGEREREGIVRAVGQIDEKRA